ncbi:hypothetical protein Zmor_028090 [Zophobas morio]|uniref:Odorant receptor n=1 Tax=Zophobas morio TaxID=2755281 RepID=A0AA38M2P2_9CUCU|nr:hypothetical protein Zmor_028090 [Zophobas morio]
MIILKNDNIGAEKLSGNPIFPARSKHTDLRLHLIRDCVKKKEIVIEHVATEEMTALILTKELSKAKHEKCIQGLGMRRDGVKCLFIKPMKYCLLAISLILSPLILLQGYFFLKKFELKYFVQYEPIYIVLLYMVVSIYCQAYTINIIKTYIHEIQVWKIEEATKEIKGKVTQTWIYITAYMCTTTALSLLGTISFIVPTSRDKDLIFVFKISELYFPQWENFVVWCLKLTLFVLTYVGVSVPGFAILYFHGHANLQKFMLKHCLQDINARFEHVEYIRWNNVEYHREIEDKLMSCVKYHIQLTETALIPLRLAEVYVLPFQIMGTCVVASILLVFFAFEGSLSDQYFRMVVLVLTTSAMLVGFAAGGQGIEDWSEEIYETLSQVEWYHWNSKNKKTYLFFLMHATRKFKIKYSENISLNYQLGLKVVNALFSAMSVIYSLQQKKYS